MNSHFGATALLLNDNRVDKQRMFREGLTYINIAATQNNVKLLKYVIEKVGIDIKNHGVNNFFHPNVSPLFSAIAAGMPDTVDYLLTIDGIDAKNVAKSTSVSAIWIAVKMRKLEITKLLIEKTNSAVTAKEIDLAKRNEDTEMIDLLEQYYGTKLYE